MSQPPLRFVHAGDLHLERPLSGVAEVPPTCARRFSKRRISRREQIFETALTEGADALLLAGDVVHLDRAGPRAIVFLLEQFAARRITTSPSTGPAGRSIRPTPGRPTRRCRRTCTGFPRVASAISNISAAARRSPASRASAAARGRRSTTAGSTATRTGCSPSAWRYGTAAAPGAEGDRVHYMALGGQHRRQTVDQSPGIAHYAGTPQGRDPSETGACGCTVVTRRRIGPRENHVRRHRRRAVDDRDDRADRRRRRGVAAGADGPAHRQPADQAPRSRPADHLEHPRPRRAAQSPAAGRR